MAEFCMTACFSPVLSMVIFNTDISQGSVVTQLRRGELLMKILLQIYQWICRWKNFENQSTFGEVMGNVL